MIDDKAMLDWLERHKDCEFEPLNTHVPRFMARVRLSWAMPHHGLRQVTGDSVREAIRKAMEKQKAEDAREA